MNAEVIFIRGMVRDNDALSGLYAVLESAGWKRGSFIHQHGDVAVLTEVSFSRPISEPEGDAPPKSETH